MKAPSSDRPSLRQVHLVSNAPRKAASAVAGSQLARIGVSLPGPLLAQVDDMVAERGLPGRSQLIAELIRHEVADVDRDSGHQVRAGTLTLILRAHSGRARHALARVQGAFVTEVI